MAIIVVKGEITRMKDFPATKDREAQVNVTVQDGERYGMYVPADAALALCELGDLVEVAGRLRVSGKYLNVDDPILRAVADVKWSTPGA